MIQGRSQGDKETACGEGEDGRWLGKRRGSRTSLWILLLSGSKVAHSNLPLVAGCGCCIVVETSTGCLLGAAVPGKRGVAAEAVAAAAVSELQEALSSGACVDQWLQAGWMGRDIPWVCAWVDAYRIWDRGLPWVCACVDQWLQEGGAGVTPGCVRGSVVTAIGQGSYWLCERSSVYRRAKGGL